MKINPDGSFDLENGETVPFICPKDGWPIEYNDKILMVHCFHCGYIGSREEFSREVIPATRPRKRRPPGRTR